MEKELEVMDFIEEENKGVSRRQLLKWSAATGAGLLLVGKVGVPKAVAQPVCGPAPDTGRPDTWRGLGGVDPSVGSYFTDQDLLPIPQVLSRKGADRLADYYEIPVVEAAQKLHSQIPPTPVWTYNGVYPGPTIEAVRGRKSVVKFINKLPQFSSAYAGCVDPMVMGAESLNGMPYIVTHLHGGAVPPEFDGFPQDRIPPSTPDFVSSFTHEYPNEQLAATLWYHDHSQWA